MRASKLIIEKILNDNDFSIEVAKRLNLRQSSVLGLARRNSDKLLHYQAVKFYQEQGYTEKEFMEAEKTEKQEK
ncbi:hypothetical protein [Ornithobacterium rhinotracheale]|uniref:hypothetical protein n=1 Tax=Ornithobacterium rhinotracheale TaxID=28251 RepID=UPI00129CD611|nr:hypothetical protein [Ornithobacterium rhinotracheale]MRI64206.1 hypothetical protein [Ornithobacterium rhinotracheale]MRJ09059.1 hypothetical protein [Ornithobacterium rhinotracheale]MRJ11375.1 hypothetical protein [Ornithobacterium rhinotracheale]UOH77831.1 hypothetical protein MT996_11600 [Ornithobacterium rhinotracheale]